MKRAAAEQQLSQEIKKVGLFSGCDGHQCMEFPQHCSSDHRYAPGLNTPNMLSLTISLCEFCKKKQFNLAHTNHKCNSLVIKHTFVHLNIQNWFCSYTVLHDLVSLVAYDD